MYNVAVSCLQELKHTILIKNRKLASSIPDSLTSMNSSSASSDVSKVIASELQKFDVGCRIPGTDYYSSFVIQPFMIYIDLDNVFFFRWIFINREGVA